MTTARNTRNQSSISPSAFVQIFDYSAFMISIMPLYRTCCRVNNNNKNNSSIRSHSRRDFSEALETR